MRLVALVRTVDRPDEAAKALAQATGLTVAEARMRLAPEPPTPLARLDGEKADALVRALRGAGLAVLALELSQPFGKDRIEVQRFSLDEEGGEFTARSGDPVRVPWAEVTAILRGLRVSTTEIARTEKKRSFSPGLALVTGGFVTSKKSVTISRSSSEGAEQVIFLFRAGGKTVLFAERALEFSCLGPAMQPSSVANMVELARRLRERAKGAFYDERLLRLGRRTLPLFLASDSRSETATTVTTRSDTTGSLDVLAEMMRQALEEGLLP
jgi:hypothetical protein